MNIVLYTVDVCYNDKEVTLKDVWGVFLCFASKLKHVKEMCTDAVIKYCSFDSN